MTQLTPVRDIPAYAVIIRCISMRGPDQVAALAELDRRGLWLADKQKQQAGLPVRVKVKRCPGCDGYHFGDCS